MQKIKAVLGVALLSLFVTSYAHAAEFVSPAKDNQNVTVPAGEKHTNLYIAGGNVTVSAVTYGDLTAAGGSVTVDGNIEKGALIAGGTLVINGQIGGNARIAGGNITINAPIGGDLIVGGGNITLTDKASVGGDLVVGGGNVTVNAPVSGSVKVGAGSVTLNSYIGGSTLIKASKNVVFGSKAVIAAPVNYTSPKEATFETGSKVTKANFTKLESKRGLAGFAAILTLAFLIKLLAWILGGLLLVKFRLPWIYEISASVQQKPWENLGWGLLAFIAVPIAIILLLVILVGYYAAFILGLMYILALALANLVSALVFGYLLLKYMSKQGENPVDWQAVVIGVVVLTLIKLIPVIGFIFAGILGLMVFGAITRGWRIILFSKKEVA